MSNTFKIDLTSDMLLEELFFPLGEVYRTTDFSHLKHIDVPSNRMRAYAETAKKDIEEQITKNRLIAKEDRNSGAAPRYRDFSRGMMNGQHLSNRLFKANMYKLDNTNKCNMKDIVTNKTTKISTGGSWALYDFMNNLRGIRDWKVWYESRRCINEDVPFDTRRVLEYTMTDLMAALGGYYIYNWKSYYNQYWISLGLKTDNDLYSEHVKFDNTLSDIEANIRNKVIENTDFQYLSNSIKDLERFVANFRNEATQKKTQSRYLIVSHGKQQNYKRDEWKGARSLGTFSTINRSAHTKWQNALVLDLKVFDKLIACLKDSTNFDVEIKKKEEREKLNATVTRTIKIMNIVAPFEEGHELYWGHRDWDGNTHPNNHLRHTANTRIKLERIKKCCGDLRTACMAAFGSNDIDLETFVRVNAFRTAIKRSWSKTEGVVGEERMEQLSAVDSALEDYTKAANNYLSAPINFDDEREITYDDIVKSLEVLSSPNQNSSVLTNRQWKNIDLEELQARSQLIMSNLTNTEKESVLEQKYRESLDTASYIYDRSNLIIDAYEKEVKSLGSEIDSHVKYIEICREEMWLQQVRKATGIRDSDTLKGGSLVAKDTGSDANE